MTSNDSRAVATARRAAAASLRFDHRVSVGAEGFRNRPSDQRFVVDDQHTQASECFGHQVNELGQPEINRHANHLISRDS